MSSIFEFSQDVDTAVAPSPLPVGTYPAEIVRAEIKTSANTGNQYLALAFRISPDSYPVDFVDGDPDGETLPYNRLVLEDSIKGRWRVKRLADAIGFTVKGALDPNEMIGLTANVVIGQSEFEGENRAEIQKIVAA